MDSRFLFFFSSLLAKEHYRNNKNMATTAPQRIFPQQALLHRTFTSGFTPMFMLSLEYLSGLKWDGFGRKFANSLFNPIQTAPSLIN